MKVPQKLHVCELLAVAALLLGLSSAYRGFTAPCLANFQCESGWCDQGTGTCMATLSDGSACTVGLHEMCENERCSAQGFCASKEVIGQPCVAHEDCWESYCSANVCTEYLPRMSGVIREDQCQADFQCGSHLCTANPKRCTFQSSEGAVCGRNEDCLDGRCKNGQCIGRKWHNATCDDDDDCLTLRCENQSDFDGKNGICMEPLFPGQTGCDEPSDCYMQLCNPDTTECVATVEDVPDGAPIGMVPGQPNTGGGSASGGGAIIQDDGSSKSEGFSWQQHGALILTAAAAMIMMV